MVTMVQMEVCHKLSHEGLVPVSLVHGDDTPTPGLILYSDTAQTRLERVMPDGRVIDLLKVWRLAEDCVRHWREDDPFNLPLFVGDFKRLTPLAEALNGRAP